MCKNGEEMKQKMKIAKKWGLVLAFVAGAQVSAIPVDAKAAAPRDDSSSSYRMSGRGPAWCFMSRT